MDVERDAIDFERGEEDVFFVESPVDTGELAEKDDPRSEIFRLLEEEGLEMEDVELVALLKDEFCFEKGEDPEVLLDGERIE
ncbi:MAG: hypothetical protein ABEK01_03835 [Candidatus Nanohaloarchaea archaeon]